MLDEVAGERVGGGVGPAAGTDLGVYVTDVPLHGANAKYEIVGDLVVGTAAGHEPEHLDLTLRQTIGRRGRTAHRAARRFGRRDKLGVVLLHGGVIVAEGTPDEIRSSKDALVQQFIQGKAEGPVPLRQSGKDLVEDLLEGASE